MSDTSITATSLRRQLKSALKTAEGGGRVYITRHGKVVAILSSYPENVKMVPPEEIGVTPRSHGPERRCRVEGGDVRDPLCWVCRDRLAKEAADDSKAIIDAEDVKESFESVGDTLFSVTEEKIGLQRGDNTVMLGRPPKKFITEI